MSGEGRAGEGGDRARSGRLPDAIVIGATKAGTTSLFRYLAEHPDVFVHAQKELRFFCDPARLRDGLEHYRRGFAAAGERVAVEFSNGYARDPVYPGVPARIAAACPDVRLVYLVRDPMSRLESHYRHRLAMGREWREPSAAVRAEPSYLAASLYGHQLSLYRRHFARERILVLRAERLFAEAEARGRLCAFLGVRHDPEQPWPAENRSAGRPIAPASLRWVYGISGSERAASLARRAAGIGPLGTHAGAVRFALEPALRAALESRFEEDRRLLARLAGEAVAGLVRVRAGEERAPGGEGAGRRSSAAPPTEELTA